MRILFVSRDFSGASLCLRLLHEGNEVRAIIADPCYRQIMDGLVEKIDDLDAGINWVGRDGKSDPVIFLFLSLNYDPFITTAYLRHGAFNGMSRRDWPIFLGSTVVANVYWTLACFMGISLVEWVWGWLAG